MLTPKGRERSEPVGSTFVLYLPLHYPEEFWFFCLVFKTKPHAFKCCGQANRIEAQWVNLELLSSSVQWGCPDEQAGLWSAGMSKCEKSPLFWSTVNLLDFICFRDILWLLWYHLFQDQAPQVAFSPEQLHVSGWVGRWQMFAGLDLACNLCTFLLVILAYTNTLQHLDHLSLRIKLQLTPPTLKIIGEISGRKWWLEWWLRGFCLARPAKHWQKQHWWWCGPSQKLIIKSNSLSFGSFCMGWIFAQIKAYPPSGKIIAALWLSLSRINPQNSSSFRSGPKCPAVSACCATTNNICKRWIAYCVSPTVCDTLGVQELC